MLIPRLFKGFKKIAQDLENDTMKDAANTISKSLV